MKEVITLSAEQIGNINRMVNKVQHVHTGIELSVVIYWDGTNQHRKLKAAVKEDEYVDEHNAIDL